MNVENINGYTLFYTTYILYIVANFYTFVQFTLPNMTRDVEND